VAGRSRDAAQLAALILFSAVVGVLAVVPAVLPKPTARQIRYELLAELRPVVLENCQMQRFGSPNDGGYLMCANLLGDVQSAYSYGIGPADAWGCEIAATYNVTVHQYDCFAPPEGPCSPGRSVFHDECIGPRTETIEGRPFDTLTKQLARNGDTGKTLVMKIDIEGAELDSLMSTSDRVLDRIDQLAMEIHGTNRKFVELVRRLKRRFYLVHLHFNNQACGVRYSPLPAWAYQVLFVNKRIGRVDPGVATPILPHPLDAPDYVYGADCQIHGEVNPRPRR
jgi:hypothetical protein